MATNRKRSRRNVRMVGLPHSRFKTFTTRFPRPVLIKPPRVMFIELKRETGQLTIEQRYVMDMLGECSEIETHIARPTDWSQVVEWLS